MLDFVRFMFRMSESRAIIIALASLHRLYVEARPEPYARTTELRAILALLHVLSGGPAKPYVDYWTAATEPREKVESDLTAKVMRRNQMLGSWHGILHAFGLPSSIELSDAIARVERADRDAVPPAEQKRL
ncbi:hypothetical protein [Sphingomonas sp. VNH70]|uniref:hypothetical protein n=1 Tax=Sphingomonas silueang TaxID=3156617 RepID=UPI0032B589E4